MLGRTVGAVQWVVGVVAATCVVMLFTLGGADDPSSTGDSTGSDGDGAGATDAAVIDAGRELYAAQCAVCHGAEGQGGTGPRLAGTVVALYPDVADQVAVVAEGRSGMRGFAGRLTDDEIEAIVAFTREGL